MPISDRYSLTAYFYTDRGYEFRKYLNIKRRAVGLQKVVLPLRNWWLDDKPDLMVVMMNPGSSTPLSGGSDGQLEVAAKPDNTLKQIMKVMDGTGFAFARILNLSDLRNPNSPDFLSTLKSLDHAGIQHSIFSPGRENDFDEMFVQSVPVILAWGADDRLKPLARRALNRIKNSVQIGHKKPGTQSVYYHACQRGKSPELWVNEIVRQLS